RFGRWTAGCDQADGGDSRKDMFEHAFLPDMIFYDASVSVLAPAGKSRVQTFPRINVQACPA
ncbi:MAG: hypothetical protein AAGJ68_08900, partial [Pseudomonadota bacterium]